MTTTAQIGRTLHRRGRIELVIYPQSEMTASAFNQTLAPKSPTNNFALLDEREIDAWEWRELTKLDKLYEENTLDYQGPWKMNSTDEMIDDHDNADGWSQVKVDGIIMRLE